MTSHFTRQRGDGDARTRYESTRVAHQVRAPPADRARTRHRRPGRLGEDRAQAPVCRWHRGDRSRSAVAPLSLGGIGSCQADAHGALRWGARKRQQSALSDCPRPARAACRRRRRVQAKAVGLSVSDVGRAARDVGHRRPRVPEVRRPHARARSRARGARHQANAPSQGRGNRCSGASSGTWSSVLGEPSAADPQRRRRRVEKTEPRPSADLWAAICPGPQKQPDFARFTSSAKRFPPGTTAPTSSLTARAPLPPTNKGL